MTARKTPARAAPATAMQHGLLLESTLSGRPWANLEQIVVDGALPLFDPDRMRLAWETVAQRHDALRMVLPPDGKGGIGQHVLEAPALVLVTQDLSGLDPDAQAKAVESFLADDRLAGVDPAQSPGWRISLLTLSPARVIMVWTIHHALIDGTSMVIVLQELGDLLCDRPLASRPALGFAGFAAGLATLERSNAKALFAGMFADGAGSVGLIGSGVVPGDGALGRMALCARHLDAEQTAALRRNVVAMGATPLNAVQAVWGLVLARWTGQAEACFGLVDSGRRLLPGHERTVGCLISTLPMRVQFTGDETLGQVLRDLRETTLAMRSNAHASLTEVRRWAGLPGQTPLFDTIVMHTHSALGARLQALGPEWKDWPVRVLEEGTALATLAVTETPQVEILLEYDPGRLTPGMAQSLIDQVATLLVRLASADAETRLSDLEMFDGVQTRALLDLGRPQTALPDAPPCIATRFEAVAAAQPGAVAIRDASSGASLDYRGLNGAANALATRLWDTGVRSGDVVALHLPRGIDHVTALLAVLKLGAAFLPLDPDLPDLWLSGLAERAGAKALIAPETSGLPFAIRLVPDVADVRVALAFQRPPPQGDRLAYVLFTSGSTGVPKAVRGLCGALSAHASATGALFDLTPLDRVLHFAGLGFDVALEEIVPTLLAGATLVIRDAAAAGSARGFLDFVAREAITVVNLPASFWHVLVDEMAGRGLRLPPSVRLVIAGSERIRPQALRRWQSVAPDVTWINGYGPTETTITATAFTLSPGTALPEPLTEVPIGRPLAHARAVLRAFDGTLTPCGGVGALWIGGAAVTGGYLSDPVRNAEVFRPDPWTAGGRLYNTGDQARWRADGELEFLGRQDRQIKLRGHRIDLHQIERLLTVLKEVREAHVALVEEGISARLIGWVVPETGVPLSRIARIASHSMPRYMVPQLIALDRLPIGANGKINSRALPFDLPEAARVASKQSASTDPLVQSIAACMAEVLERQSIPADAEFSDLGGDSLLALRLVSLIEQRTGHALQTANLHHHGSAEALARLLHSGVTAPRYTIPIQPTGNKPAFFAIHVLGRNEDLFRPLAAAMGPDQPMFGLSVGIPRNLDDINVERTARIYFDEIQTYHPNGPVGLAAVSMAAYFAYELAQLLHEAGREVRVLAVLDAMGPDGRPALDRIGKLRAHARQVRRHGLSHFGRVMKNRFDRYREHRESLRDTPGQVSPLNLIAANVCAVEFYQPKPYDGPLTVFRADHSFWDSPKALATGLGWASVARGGFQIHDLPGTHLSILEPGNVEILAAHLRRLMQDGT